MFKRLLKTFRRLVIDNDGATAMEYGLIVALVAIGALAAFKAFSVAANNLLDYVSSSFLSAAS